MKRGLVKILAVFSVFISGLGLGLENEAFCQEVLHVGGTVSPEHSWYKATEQFKQDVESATNGRIQVQIEMGGVHGGERKMVTDVMRGVLDMIWTSDIGLAAVFPRLGFVNLPYLFESYEDVDKRYLNGWMGEILEKESAQKNVLILAHGENDFRAVTNSKKPLKSGNDFKGLKLRVPEVPIYISFYRNLGALPTPMAITEVPTALQQGTVDGQDNGAIITYDFGLHQFQKYMTRANQIYSGAQFLMNLDKFNKFSEADRKIIKEAAVKSAQYQVEINRNIVDEYYSRIEKSGVEVGHVSEQLAADMRVAARKVWESPETIKAFGKDVIDRIIAEAK